MIKTNDLYITTEEWDELEVHPIKNIGEGYLDVCEPEEADFWSVYIHLKSGGVECIADCADSNSANMLCLLIRNLIKTHKPTTE